MTIADQEIRQALSRAAAAVPADVEGRLRETNRRGPRRAKARRTATVIVAAIVTAAALLLVALLLPLRRELRPGAGPSPGRIAYTVVSVSGDAIDWDVYMAAADGSEAEPILTGPEATYGPALSSNGRRLAYFAAEPDASSPSLWIAGADGTDAGPVPGVPAPTADSAASWSPDGSRLALIASEAGGEITNDLWLVDVETDAAEEVLSGNWQQVAWSPRGDRLALTGFRGRAGNPGLFVVNTDGTGLVRLTDGEGVAAIAYPSWSPDGERIAFMTRGTDDPGDYRYDIHVVGVDGGGATALTDWEGFDGFPVWSPDGSRILYSSDRAASQRQLARNRAGEGWSGASLFVMRPDGSDPRLLLPAGEASLLPTSWVR